ncbi:MAG: cation:proton antiporter [Bacteroidetes bacterium]|nr:cation:proton antiporter [Bacteroidota bacterium]
MEKNLELFIHASIAIILILIVCHAVGSLMKYIKQPAVVGEMIAGVLLGPTLFGNITPGLFAAVFHPTYSVGIKMADINGMPAPRDIDIISVIFMFSNIGLSFYMFLVGSEIDYKYFDKKSLKQGGWLSITATVTPFVLGAAAGWYYYNSDLCNLAVVNRFGFMIFMGTAISITAFPMLARILQENNLINTKLGIISLVSASIQDVASWIMLAFVLATLKGEGLTGGFITFGGAFVFIAACFLVLKPLLKYLERSVVRANRMTGNHFAIVLVIVLVCAVITDKLGLYCVFGGFFSGLVMPRNALFQRELQGKLRDIVMIFFLPMFFTFSGLNTDLTHIVNLEVAMPFVVIMLLAFVGKYVPGLLTMRAQGFSWRESSGIGSLIYARGLMDLIVANIGLAYNIITPNTFAIIVLVAVVSTLAATPLFWLTMAKVLKQPD